MSQDIMAGIPLDFMMPPPPGEQSPGAFAAPAPPALQGGVGGAGGMTNFEQPSSNVALMSNPTRVILLRVGAWLSTGYMYILE